MEVDLIEIFDNHIKKGLAYCCICLRSEKETRLVDSEHLALFTSHVNLNRSFVNLNMNKACYMCESQAKIALRMYQACVNAIAACTLVKQLRKMNTVNRLPPKTQQAVRVCNTRLKAIRVGTQLRNTEVLVIDSTGVRLSETFGAGSKVPSTTKPKPFSSDFETVVLDDDDDDNDPLSTANKKNKAPIKVQNKNDKQNTPFIATDEKNRVRTNQIMFIQNEENQTIPVLIVDSGNVGQNGNLAALPPNPAQRPVANSQIHSNSNSQPPKAVPTLQSMPRVQNNQTNTFIFQPEDFAALFNQNENTIQLPSKNSENDEVDKLLFNKLSSLRSEAKKAKPSYLIDIDTVNKMIEDKKDCLITNTVSKEAPLAVISKVVSEAKTSKNLQPLPKEDAMVDFEDKIPMDVISFMDATDPNAAESILPDPLPNHNQFGNINRPPAKRKVEEIIFTID